MGINCCQVPTTMQQPSPNRVPQQMAAPPPTYNQQQNQYLQYQQQQQWMMANQQPPPPPQQQQPYQYQPQPQQMYYQQQQPPQAAAVAVQLQYSVAAAAQPGGSHFTIFVGDLAPDVTDQVLQQTFSPHYPSVKGAKIVTDMMTGRAKGYGFVRFGDEGEQLRAMHKRNGKYCSTRPMRIGPANRKNTALSNMEIYCC